MSNALLINACSQQFAGGCLAKSLCSREKLSVPAPCGSDRSVCYCFRLRGTIYLSGLRGPVSVLAQQIKPRKTVAGLAANRLIEAQAPSLSSNDHH